MFRALRLIALSAMITMGVGMFAAASPVRAAEFSDINGPQGGGAQGLIFAGICSGAGAVCPCRDSGDCTLDDALQVFVNISTFILGISGSVVLFVFVYGGFKWLFSRGDSKWVEEGKKAMTAGVMGLGIIFGAYVAINFIVSGLTTPAGTTPASGNLEDTVNQGLTGDDVKNAPDDVFTTE
jgi:hypothetical protein